MKNLTIFDVKVENIEESEIIIDNKPMFRILEIFNNNFNTHFLNTPISLNTQVTLLGDNITGTILTKRKIDRFPKNLIIISN
jgi:hypothetical protein